MDFLPVAGNMEAGFVLLLETNIELADPLGYQLNMIITQRILYNFFDFAFWI